MSLSLFVVVVNCSHNPIVKLEFQDNILVIPLLVYTELFTRVNNYSRFHSSHRMAHIYIIEHTVIVKHLVFCRQQRTSFPRKQILRGRHEPVKTTRENSI